MVTALGINAQTTRELEFDKANFYYNESKYDTAVMYYERILSDGFVSVPLLYNMGNAYFKMRNYPMAILNYEKALKLDPDNEDVKYNLAIANSIITDKIEPVPEFFMSRWWRHLGDKMSANGWASASLVLFGALLLVLFLYFTARTKGLKKAMFFVGLLLVLMLVCSLIFASQRRSRMAERSEAIVMTPTITVKSSPSSSGTDLFVLHEGTKVQILDHAGDWDKIKIADGSVGWMPASTSIKY